MAIYNIGDVFYVNGVANPNSPGRRKVLPAHEFDGTQIKALLRVYRHSVIVQVLLMPVIIWYGLLQKIFFEPMSFGAISLLAMLVSVPVFLAWICTLCLRTGVSTFCLMDVTLQIKPSSTFNLFYSVSGANLFLVFISAPWGMGWGVPAVVVPPVALFAVVLLGASYRLIKLVRS